MIASFTATNGIVTCRAWSFGRVPTRRLTVLDHHSSADVEALTLPWPRWTWARVACCVTSREPARPSGVAIASQVARAAGSSTLLANVALAATARVRTDARLEAGARRAISSPRTSVRAADARLPHSQDHAAPKTTSDLLFKGAVGDALARCTAGSSAAQRSAGHHRLPDEPQPQAEREVRGPTRFRTSRSTRTTCAAAMRQPSVRSTPSSASISRAAACPPSERRSSSSTVSSARSSSDCRFPTSPVRCVRRSPSSSVEGTSYDPRAPVLDP